MDHLNFNEIGIEALARGKETHQFEELSGRIIGAAIEVHRELGPKFFWKVGLLLNFALQNPLWR